MNISHEWKGIAITSTDDEPSDFDLLTTVNLKIAQPTAGDITIGQPISGGVKFQGKVDTVLVKGEHAGRRFTITCKWTKITETQWKWKSSGVLHAKGTEGGGEGTWTAEEGP